MKIFTADRETGTFIEQCKSIEEAKKLILSYEETDKLNGEYEENFYSIVNEDHATITPTYYRVCYDRRLGGDCCEVYDNDLNLIEVVRKATSVDGLIRIERKNSTISHLYETSDINDKYVLLKDRLPGAATAAASAFKPKGWN